MKYIVEINPAKEQEFLQLLQAWKSLGVVRSFGETTEQPLEIAETEDPYLKSWMRRQEKTPKELAEDYLDLVD
ncbi:MAG: hypothetical protein SFU99_04870 [Saprospiraceae bacterium]|nr:hypothetical protein [Saprospiraceae bacterium]